MSIRLL